MNSFTEKGLVWPLVVILLLLGSVFTMVTFVFMANSDGGAKVVDSYYEKAVQWDSLSAVRTELVKRSWLSLLVVTNESGALTVLDSTEIKVSGLRGVVSLSRPHVNTASDKLDLTWQPSDSTYRFALKDMEPGVWDFKFTVEDQGTMMEFDLRKSIR